MNGRFALSHTGMDAAPSLGGVLGREVHLVSESSSLPNSARRTFDAVRIRGVKQRWKFILRFHGEMRRHVDFVPEHVEIFPGGHVKIFVCGR